MAAPTPPKASSRLQQRAFDRFVIEYNEERPHEALGDLTPSACYSASGRSFPGRVPKVEYDEETEVRRVSQQGSIRWKGERTFISEVFQHEPVGLKAVNERWMTVHYGSVELGWFDGRAHRFTRKMPRELKTNNSEPTSGMGATRPDRPSKGVDRTAVLAD